MMTELNKDWLPEVGAKCEFTWGAKTVYYTCFYHGRTQNGSYIIELEDGQLKDSEHYQNIEFRPIKTEAERRREEQIWEITAHIRHPCRLDAPEKLAERLYEAGCCMTRVGSANATANATG